MNLRTAPMMPSGPARPFATKPNSMRNNPSFDQNSRPSNPKLLTENGPQLTRQINRNQPAPIVNPEVHTHRLLQSKNSIGMKNSKEILKKLTTVMKQPPKQSRKSSEKQSSEKSLANHSRAPNKVSQSHVSRDKIPANLRLVNSKLSTNVHHLINVGLLQKNFVAKQANSKLLGNLENRKPRVSNLHCSSLGQALQTKRQLTNTSNIQTDGRGMSQEQVISNVPIKMQRLKTENPAFVSDKFAMPTTSTICEKSKDEGSPRLRFRINGTKQNVTSNAEILRTHRGHEDPTLTCEESLTSAGLSGNFQSTSLKHQISAKTQENSQKVVPQGQQNITTLNKLSINLSALDLHYALIDRLHDGQVRSDDQRVPNIVSENSSISDDKYDEKYTNEPSILVDDIKEQLVDFDHETFTNQFDNSTLHFLMSQEGEYAPNPHYLEHRQKHLKWQMRAILLDWMQEVCSDYLFKRETFHMAANFVDRYLSVKADIEKNTLQLIGLTALFLAAKMEEVYTPKVENMVAAANNTYSPAQLLAMEQRMYFGLGLKVTPPTLNLWANWYMAQWDNFLDESSHARSHPLIKSQKNLPRFRLPCEQSYALYREFMQLVDAAILDVETLKYKQRALIASFLYSLMGREFKQFTLDQIVYEFPHSSLYLLDESFAFNDLFGGFLQQCFAVALLDLLPTIQYISTYFNLKINVSLPVAAKVDKDNVLNVS